MFTPGSPGPNAFPFGGHVVPDPDLDKLTPKTTIDHLLSDEERRKADLERIEFETVGHTMFLSDSDLYLDVYESASEKIASDVSHEEIRRERLMIAETPDLPFASIILEAYEDVLAGRPPRFSSWQRSWPRQSAADRE
jgi:hypothetical protein